MNNNNHIIRMLGQPLISLLFALIGVSCNTALKSPPVEHSVHTHHTNHESHTNHTSHKEHDTHHEGNKELANQLGRDDHMNHGDGSEPMDHMTHMAMIKHDPLKYTSREDAVTLVSEKGNYRVTLYSNASPIPLQQLLYRVTR